MVFTKNASTDNYQRYSGAGFAHVILANDSTTNSIDFSLNGNSKIGELKPEETIEFRDLNAPDIFIKSTATGNAANFRLWFYGKQQIVYDKSDEILEVTKQVKTDFDFIKHKIGY